MSIFTSFSSSPSPSFFLTKDLIFNFWYITLGLFWVLSVISHFTALRLVNVACMITVSFMLKFSFLSVFTKSCHSVFYTSMTSLCFFLPHFVGLIMFSMVLFSLSAHILYILFLFYQCLHWHFSHPFYFHVYLAVWLPPLPNPTGPLPTFYESTFPCSFKTSSVVGFPSSVQSDLLIV